jgi:hypothetical protein
MALEGKLGKISYYHPKKKISPKLFYCVEFNQFSSNNGFYGCQ